MASTTNRLQRLGNYARTLDFTANAPGVTDWVCLTNTVALQITGAATAVTAVVERSTRDPNVSANAAPADEPVSGNPAEGMTPTFYVEAGVAWYRVRITELNGDAVVALSGTAGQEN